jgi:hypothetical protein
MNTANEMRKISFQSAENQKELYELEKEMHSMAKEGCCFVQMRKERARWIRNLDNIDFLESKGFRIRIKKITALSGTPEWVFVEWDGDLSDRHKRLTEKACTCDKPQVYYCLKTGGSKCRKCKTLF